MEEELEEVFEPEEEFEAFAPDYSVGAIDPNENSKASMKETMARAAVEREAESLKNNINAYKNANKGNLNGSNLKNSTSGTTTPSTKSLNKGQKGNMAMNAANLAKSAKENGIKDPETKKEALKIGATAAASAAGLPPELVNQVMNTGVVDKTLDKALKNKKDKTGNNDEIDNVSAGGEVNKGALLTALLVGCLGFILIIMIAIVGVSAGEYIDSVSFGFADDDEVSEKVDSWIGENYDDAGEIIEEEMGFNDSKLINSNMILATADLPLLVYEKLTNTNILGILSFFKKESKSNPASEEELEDFFGSSIFDVPEDDKDIVMKFYSKLYNINTYYKKNYNVSLDLPLIMSTLYIQYDDQIEVFESNAKNYNPKKDEKYFDYTYDWSSQKLKSDDSEHDIEILAQAMVSNSSGSYVVDEDKYFEFLKQFIEIKYYMNDNTELGTTETGDYGDISSGDWMSWTQCNQTWSDKIIPSSSSSVCNIGCLYTSICIQIARSGTETTITNFNPGTALSKFKFSNGGNLSWDLSNIAPNFKSYTVIDVPKHTQEQVTSILSKYDSNKYYATIFLAYTKYPTSGHHVAYLYTKDGVVYVRDPAKASNSGATPISESMTGGKGSRYISSVHIWVKED